MTRIRQGGLKWLMEKENGEGKEIEIKYSKP